MQGANRTAVKNGPFLPHEYAVIVIHRRDKAGIIQVVDGALIVDAAIAHNLAIHGINQGADSPGIAQGTVVVIPEKVVRARNPLERAAVSEGVNHPRRTHRHDAAVLIQALAGDGAVIV